MAYTADMESPNSFFWWSAVACVAGALRDNIYLPQKKSPLYPNLYVLLLADSGIDRKSTPLGVACDILGELHNTKIIRGRTSVQAILKTLGEAEMDRATGISTAGGSCFLCAEELASFFVADPSAIPLITDLYDYRKEWTSNLKGEGKITIKNLCVTLLAASNETHLREVYSTLAVYGGLLGRTLFIKSDGRREPNPMYGEDSTTLETAVQREALISNLKTISTLRGPMVVDDSAKQEYHDWYKDLYSKYGARPDKSGIIARIHTTVAKVSCILTVANTHNLCIKKHHVEEAIERCISLLPNYEIFVMTSGKADIATSGSYLLNELVGTNCTGMSKKVFLRKYWTEIDEEIFDKMTNTLQTAGLIQISMENKEIRYTLTEQGKEKLSGKSK